jgi:hypothetical protein
MKKGFPMRPFLAIALLCLLPCMAGAEDTTSATEIPVWWDQKLFRAQTTTEIEDLFNTEFPIQKERLTIGLFPPTAPLLSPYEKDKNCPDLLKHTQPQWLGDDINWQHCAALNEIRTAKPSKISYLPAFPWRRSALSFLPPLIGAEIYYPESICNVLLANEKGLSSAEYQKYFEGTKSHLSIDGLRIFLTRKENEYSIEPLARGDFNGDGIEDIILSTTYLIPDIIYEKYIYVLTRLSEKGRMIILKMPPNLEQKLIRDRSGCEEFRSYFEDVLTTHKFNSR